MVTFPALLDAIMVYNPSCSVVSGVKQFRLRDINDSVLKLIVVGQSMMLLSGGLMSWIITSKFSGLLIGT